MTTIDADGPRPGDIVIYRGESHQVTRVDRRDGWAWPVAYDDTGWALAVGHDVIVVQRAARRSDGVTSPERALSDPARTQT